MTAKWDPDDLSWLAFCYVTDELDQADRIAFEARLLNDPEACVALAQAVELVGVCLQLESPAAADRSARTCSRKRSVFALTTLVAAAVILIATITSPWSSSPIGLTGASQPTIALERAWASLQHEAFPSLLEPEDDDWFVDLAGEERGSGLDPDSELNANPPRWLLVAVDHAADPGDSAVRSSEN